LVFVIECASHCGYLRLELAGDTSFNYSYQYEFRGAYIYNAGFKPLLLSRNELFFTNYKLNYSSFLNYNENDFLGITYNKIFNNQYIQMTETESYLIIKSSEIYQEYQDSNSIFIIIKAKMEVKRILDSKKNIQTWFEYCQKHARLFMLSKIRRRIYFPSVVESIENVPKVNNLISNIRKSHIDSIRILIRY
jgi:hypothetical protein